jgi:hypothetical protein
MDITKAAWQDYFDDLAIAAANKAEPIVAAFVDVSLELWKVESTGARSRKDRDSNGHH